MFWLEGDSKINQLEQIDFLKRFFESQLPISEKTEMIMKRLLVIEETEQFIISGKTGWSIRNGNNNGLELMNYSSNLTLLFNDEVKIKILPFNYYKLSIDKC